MRIAKVLLSTCLTAALLSLPNFATAKTYDVLQLPAVPSDLAASSLIFTIAEFHGRYYATGHRGHILYSEDGDNWTQASVPVRSAILDIYFPTAEKGWAVGHEGVVLHSSDGGKTWVKQYDGLRYGTEGMAYYSRLAEEYPDDEIYSFLVDEMQFAIDQGADKPLFRVHFHSESFGHVLGAYGMILKTEDGGETWEHVLHTTENDSFYHVFDTTELTDGNFFLSGEAGLMMIGDAESETALLVDSVPWEGSFFSVSATDTGAVVVGGLRGRMFRSEDQGGSWEEVQKPPTSSIVSSARLQDGTLVFAGMAGELIFSRDDGRSFNYLPIRTGSRVYTVEHGPAGTILVGGPAGIRKFPLPQAQ